MKRETHWQVLGLQPGASRKEVQQAYRELLQVWHPDRFSQESDMRSRAGEQTKKINNAFEALDKELQDTFQGMDNQRQLAHRRTKREHTVSHSRLALLLVGSVIAVVATVGVPSWSGLTTETRSFSPLRPMMSEAIVSGQTIVVGPRHDIPNVIRAAMECDVPQLQSSLRSKANPNIEDRSGVSALSWAARMNCLQGAELLIAHGADLNARSQNGFTPVVWAQTHNHRHMVQTLLRAGAAPPPDYWRRKSWVSEES